MKTIFAAAGGMTALFVMPALAADLPIKAPPMASVPGINWTGFYVFGGAGGGLWNADSNVVASAGNAQFPVGTPVTRDQRLGGSGWFGTVGAGYDWQFNRNWVAGAFADGQFGNISGSIVDPISFFFPYEGQEKLRASWAAGLRLGYLVAPSVLSYVNGGYTGSQWSGASYSVLATTVPAPTTFTTPSFRRDGWFVGGGVENSLNIFGLSAPGWFMKTEYRAAYYNRTTQPERLAIDFFIPAGSLTGTSVTFKPWVQTVSTSLVYRFDSDRPAPLYTKAQAAPPVNWTGFYLFGGAGGGMWAADSYAIGLPSNPFAILGPFSRDQRLGGSGWFGTVGAGYDVQLRSNWVAGLFADGQFGDIRGSIADPGFLAFNLASAEGTEKLRTSYAVGARLGYLVAPNVLSYFNTGYSGSEWSGASYPTLPIVGLTASTTPLFTTPSFHRDGWFVGGGVENSLDIFGISARGLFMKTEYRAAYYGRATLLETATGAGGFGLAPGTPGNALTFKPWAQTISTSLVYRFDTGGPVTAKY